MTVRVLRLLEYTFGDQETAERHMANFGIPANGVKRIGRHNGNYGVDHLLKGELFIRSAILPQETLPADPAQIPVEQVKWFAAGLEDEPAAPDNPAPSAVSLGDMNERELKEALSSTPGYAGDDEQGRMFPFHSSTQPPVQIHDYAEAERVKGTCKDCGYTKGATVHYQTPRPHSFMAPVEYVMDGPSFCTFPSCGLREDDKIHEHDAGWPPQGS